MGGHVEVIQMLLDFLAGLGVEHAFAEGAFHHIHIEAGEGDFNHAQDQRVRLPRRHQGQSTQDIEIVERGLGVSQREMGASPQREILSNLAEGDKIRNGPLAGPVFVIQIDAGIGEVARGVNCLELGGRRRKVIQDEPGRRIEAGVRPRYRVCGPAGLFALPGLKVLDRQSQTCLEWARIAEQVLCGGRPGNVLAGDRFQRGILEGIRFVLGRRRDVGAGGQLHALVAHGFDVQPPGLQRGEIHNLPAHQQNHGEQRQAQQEIEKAFCFGRFEQFVEFRIGHGVV